MSHFSIELLSSLLVEFLFIRNINFYPFLVYLFYLLCYFFPYKSFYFYVVKCEFFSYSEV